MAVLRPVPNSQGSERLVVFHHAGGNANQYFLKLKGWKDKFEVLMLDLPGRNFRLKEPAFTQSEELFKVLISEFENLPRKPSYFLGHSMGALIAYEMAWRILERKLFPIKRMALSALQPIHMPKARRRISTLSQAELLEEIESFSPIPGVVKDNPEILRMAVQVIRNDLSLMESYEHRRSGVLSVPTIVLGGSKDPKITPDILENWRTLVAVEGNVKIYPGEHFFIFNYLDEVIQELTR